MDKRLPVLLVLLFNLQIFAQINQLPNPGFEKIDPTGKLPLQWFVNRSGAEGTAVADNLNAAEGKSSVRMQQTSEKGWMALVAQINLSKPTTSDRPITVSVRVNANQLAQGMLVITAGTKEQPQKQWERAAFWFGSFGWKTFQKKMILKAGVNHIVFSIRTNGKGMMWVDDASFTFDDETPKTEYKNLLVNGDLSGPPLAATGLPKGWHHNAIDTLEAIGNASWSKDGRQTPGSLRLQWQSGAQTFGAEAELKEKIKPSCAYEASALVKTAADGKAMFGIVLLDATGNTISKNFSPGVTAVDWQTMKFEFTTPPDAAGIRFSCFSGATGAVQFDAVALRETGKKVEEQALPLEARCFPVEWNADYTGGKLEFNTFTDAPIPLAFHFRGGIKELKNPALIVDFPVQVKMVEAYPTHAGWYGEEKFTTEPITRPEGSYVRYRFVPKAFSILTPTYTYERKIAMLLMPANETGAANQSYPIFWHLENNGQKNREKTFNVNFLPPLPERELPENFHIVRWESMDYQIPRNEWFEKSLSVLERAGIRFHSVTSNFARGEELRKILKSRNWNFNYSLIEYLYIKYNNPEVLKALGDRIEYVVRDNGQPNKELFCPDYVVDDPEYIRLFNEGFAKSLKARGVQSGEWVALDLEPFGTMQWCFCERCRRKFAAQFNIVPVPDTKTIKEKYSNEWVQFRCENTALQVKHYADVIRNTIPGAVVVDYDYIVDYSKPNYRSAYSHVAKDPELNEQYIDQHLNSYYHTIDKRAFDMMKINIRHLKKPYMPVIAISGIDYLVASEVMVPAQVRLMMLAAAVNGCNGTAIYPGIHLDGKFLRVFNETLAEVTALQRFFVNAKTDAPDITANARHYRENIIGTSGAAQTLRFPIWTNYFASSAIPLKRERLVSLFNYHPKETMFVDVTADSGNGEYTVFDPISRKLIIPKPGQKTWTSVELKKGILMEVKPFDARFLVIRPATQDDLELPVGSAQPAIEAKFRQAKKNFGTADMVKPVKSENLEIKVTDTDNDGAPELELHSPGQMLRIDFSHGGSITEWLVRGASISAGGEILFSEERIWLPSAARSLFSSHASVKSAVIENKTIKIVLEKTAATLPLTLRKTIIVKETSPGFTVDYQLVNNGSANCEFSLWVKNMLPVLPGSPLYFNERDNKMSPVDSSHGEHIYTAGQGFHPGFPPTITRGVLSGAKSTAQSGGLKITVANDYAKLMNYYYWTSPTIATWEWMYKPAMLTPGQSWQTTTGYSVTWNQ